jgi:hypothetical protein
MCQKQFCYRQTHIKTVCESECTKRRRERVRERERERERETERHSMVGMIWYVLFYWSISTFYW